MMMRLNDLSFSDLHVPSSGGHQSYFVEGQGRAGVSPVPNDVRADVDALRASIEEVNRHDGRSFLLVHDEVRYRVTPKDGLQDTWYCCRRLKDGFEPGAWPPDDPWVMYAQGGMPRIVVDHLIQAGQRPGLLAFCGHPGARKTTSAVALWRDWLATHGGVGWTIEYPPEHALDGPIVPAGHSHQIRVEDDGEIDRHLVDVLRLSPRYLFLGEARRGEEFRNLLTAGHFGITVLTTMHAGSLVSAIQKIIEYSARDANDYQTQSRIVSEMLNAIIWQRLVRTARGNLAVQYQCLFMTETVRRRIATGDLHTLKEDMEQQQRCLKNRMMIDF
jgi:hypothetical protein